jgi:hypothetical protein
MVRVGKPMLTLYHFTPPANLPSILAHGILPRAKDDNVHMVGDHEVVWLTENPEGNQVTDAMLTRWQELRLDDTLAEYEAGRRLVFGVNEYGSARITVEVRERMVVNYVQLLNAAVDPPEAVPQLLKALVCAHEWWLVFGTVPANCITEVHPVGDATPHYLEVIEQIKAGELVD